jgi:hypothetical protein
MEIYLVGGAVRDELLGRAVADVTKIFQSFQWVLPISFD